MSLHLFSSAEKLVVDANKMGQMGQPAFNRLPSIKDMGGKLVYKPNYKNPSIKFVGFDTELSTLVNRLQVVKESHMVVVMGDPGMGVTTFAQKAGYMLSDQRCVDSGAYYIKIDGCGSCEQVMDRQVITQQTQRMISRIIYFTKVNYNMIVN